MNPTMCDRNHIYDRDVHEQCPYCSLQNEDGALPYMPSTYKDGQPYVFISYAHADFKEVSSVLNFLKSNHFSMWYDEGIKSGHEWADEICRKIKKSKQFICFISRNSINSKSVKDEINIAWKYNINIIVIYLEKIELDGGLEMKLDRKQAILKYMLAEAEFQKKLSLAISPEVLNISDGKPASHAPFEERYEIECTLSKGGTSRVYLARNKATGVKVAIKHGTYDGTLSGKMIKRSFEAEKDILSKNISPFVPALYDYYCDEQNIYIVQSYIEGTSIGAMAYKPLCEIIKLFIEAAKVIREFHRCGIYHCDLKPEHIIVNRHGCFLIDFGSTEDMNATVSDDGKMGTVTYAAPEQFVSYNGENDIFGIYGNDVSSDCDRSIDERTDIYALGRVMIKVISNDNGCLWYDDSFPVTTVLFADVSRTIGEFSDNPLLQAIIEKMVRDKKSERYKNMDEVIGVLEDFLKIYDR